jgi:hypothetical protein
MSCANIEKNNNNFMLENILYLILEKNLIVGSLKDMYGGCYIVSFGARGKRVIMRIS